MSINATECSVANGAAVAANICCLRPKQHEPRAQRGWLPMGFTRSRRCVRYMHASRFAPVQNVQKKRTKRHVAHRASPRHCHACARCSAPCTRAHACRARSSRTHHACAPRQPCTCSTRQHTLARARQKLDVMLEALAAGWPSAGWRPAHTHDPQMPRRLRCSRGPCVIHTLCPPFTTAVATVCSEMMMTSEMETNETMQKTENTIQDARECARPAPAALIRENA